MIWPLQDAKQRFSELVDRARSEGAQIVTRRGREVVVVIAVERYRELVADDDGFKKLLLSGPDLGQLEIIRPGDGRAVEL